MPEYVETAKKSIVHHGIKALTLGVTASEACLSFMVALQDLDNVQQKDSTNPNADADPEATLPVPDQSGDPEQGTQAMQTPFAETMNDWMSVRDVLQKVGNVEVSSVNQIPIADADKFIQQILRFITKADMKKLFVEVINGTKINFVVACLTPAAYKAAVIWKSTPSFDSISLDLRVCVPRRAARSVRWRSAFRRSGALRSAV